jgi:MoxR-like ATPase
MAKKDITAGPIYPAAELFVERSLRNGSSFVTGAPNVWAQAPADEFYERFVVNEKVGAEAAGGFAERLVAQLQGASTETVLLASDLACLSALPVSDMAYETKLKRLQTVLSAIEPPPKIDPIVLEAFKTGIASYGAGHTVVWKYMQYLADFARAWVSLSAEERDRCLGDPWAWKDLVVGRPGGTGGQAAALLHLVFPEVFESIVSADARAAIVKTFSRVAGVEEESDADRKLLLIRAALEPVLGTTFHFWSPAVEPVWRGKPTDKAWAFARFAEAFRRLEKFEKDEVDYKLTLAARLQEARKSVLDADPGWLDLLKQAFANPNNITSWRQRDTFLKWCESEPQESRAVLESIWKATSPDTAELGRFLDAVPDSAIDSPGGRANFISYLFGAWEPQDWINYKPSASDRALALCGLENAETADVAGRIARFTSFIDQLRVRVVALGGPASTRLEAQSMAWMVTSDYVPDDWTSEERDALVAFRGGAPPPPPPPSELRAWHFRGFRFPDGSRASRQWLDGEFVSTFWAELGPVESGATMDEISERTREVFPDDPPGRQRTTTGNVYRFATGIKVGDLVVTTEGSSVYVGRVTGESTWIDDAHPWIQRRRGVEWLNAESPVSRGELSPALQASLKAPFAVARISQADEVAALVDLAPPPPPAPELTLRAVTPDVAGRLFFDVSPLQEMVDLLAQKRQLVFYGPPGTGKTLVAQALAEHLTTEGGDWELAQFHPSYSYEDFMEGYRPTASADGAVSYELRPGPLRRIAADAQSDPGNPYVLVVDEINRGNIPKIFGELLFLLEYRDKPIALQYSDELFSLPPNLYVIGTMNTADRSIALVDAALRRRFFFVPFIPTEAPVNGVLRRWLAEQDRDDLPARLLDELNRRIAKDEVSIGPSYLMNGDGSQTSLERIWRYAILPLLEEHFYAAKGVDVRKDLSLEACLAAVNGVAAASEGSVATEELAAGEPEEVEV